MEVLVAMGILALLMGILLPALSAARGTGRLIRCAASMREVGMGLNYYADNSNDTFPVLCGEDWKSAYAVTFGCEIVGHTWIDAVQRSLNHDSPPWLVPLRCPEAAVSRGTRPGGVTDENRRPGSSWIMNYYCLGRKRSSIPTPADGVLVMERAFWSNTADATGMLALPHEPEAYPHPSLASGPVTGAWGWAYEGRKRNLLWVDGHVAVSPARRWPYGDSAFDRDRIRHMRFNLPGNHPLDP